MRPNSWAKAWQGLFASRPTIYISIILVVTLLGYAYQLQTQSIFACPANFYDSDHYIAYCGGGGYGDRRTRAGSAVARVTVVTDPEPAPAAEPEPEATPASATWMS